MAKSTVIVIGAGMAGLAAARRLTQAGIQVTVLEKNAWVGGRVYTDVVEGFEIDAGAQFIANFYSHTLNLIRELGLENDLIQITKGGAILREGQLHGLWPNWRVLFTDLITWRSKLTLIKSLGVLLRHWRELDVHAFYKAHRLDTSSITEYAQQALNDELLEYVIQPPLSGIFYWLPEHTAQAMLFILLKAGLGIKIFTLRHGLGQLAEAMTTDLSVYRNAAVDRVTFDQTIGSYVVEAQVDSQMRRFKADGIVCATLATGVPALFPDLNAQQRAFFETINYSTNTTTAIAVNRRLPAQFYGLLFPRQEIEQLAIVAIQSAKNPAQMPAGRDLIVLYPAEPFARQLLGEDDATVQARLKADLRSVCPAYDPGDDELFCRVYRWDQALPEFDVGHFKRLKTFADGQIETGRVVFAGDYIGGPFVEGAITSGLNAAQRLLQRLGQ